MLYLITLWKQQTKLHQPQFEYDIARQSDHTTICMEKTIKIFIEKITDFIEK